MKVSLSHKSAKISILNNCNCLNQCRLHSIIAHTSVPLPEQEFV